MSDRVAAHVAEQIARHMDEPATNLCGRAFPARATSASFVADCQDITLGILEPGSQPIPQPCDAIFGF